MSRHTPGPFALHPDGFLSGDGRAIIALSHPKQVTIGWTAAVRSGLKESERIEKEEAEANARLFAEAPDLLIALEAAQEELSKREPNHDTEQHSEIVARWKLDESIADAIARARGAK